MAIKLALLKSGEDIIADIHEMVVGKEEEDEKVIGYIFTRPCLVALNSNEISTEDEEQKTFEIKMSPWIPLSKTERMPVSLDWVITIVEPVDKLKNMYEEDVLNGTGIDQSNNLE